jgi:hypothetical protein
LPLKCFPEAQHFPQRTLVRHYQKESATETFSAVVRVKKVLISRDFFLINFGQPFHPLDTPDSVHEIRDGTDGFQNQNLLWLRTSNLGP